MTDNKQELKRIYDDNGLDAAVEFISKCGNGSTDALNAYLHELTSVELTNGDIGNARRFAQQHGDDIRYLPERKSWLVWNGKHWAFDTGDIKIRRMAKETARSIYAEAAAETNDDKRKRLVQHAEASEREPRLNAMINLAQVEPGIAAKVSQLDADQFLLNCANGTLDLNTGELREFRRGDYITRIISTPYNHDADTSAFETFLARIFNDNADLIAYVQQALGFCLTGTQSELAFFFAHGGGQNGKSTLLGACMDILEDYAAEVDPAAFMVNKLKGTGPDEAIASLYNKRLVVSTELTDGQKLSVGLVKRMTGGESIRFERKYEHGFNFKPTHKLWLCGNHEPIITDTTNSIWERLKYIPFTVYIPADERIKGFRQMLVRQQSEAILAWMVKGCIDWLDNGRLIEPKEVTGAVKDYRERSDALHDYFAECVYQKPSAIVAVGQLYKDFKRWADYNEIMPMGKRTFNNLVRERGYRSERRTDNVDTWLGIGLKKEQTEHEKLL